MTATGLKRRILRWTERTTCRLAHQVICISKSLREVAIAEGLCPPEKIKALGRGSIDGIDADRKFNPARISTESARLVRDRYQIPEGALLVGFVGRIVRDKGWIELAQAWRALREDCSSLHLLVVGPFESQDPIPARRGSDAPERSAHSSGRNGPRHAERLSLSGPSRPADVSRRLSRIALGGGGNGTARDRDADSGMRRRGT